MWVGGIRTSTTATSGSSRSTSASRPGHVHRLADDLEAGCGEGRRERLAEQDGVVGEDDPDRLLRARSRRSVSGSPGTRRRRSVEEADRVDDALRRRSQSPCRRRSRSRSRSSAPSTSRIVERKPALLAGPGWRCPRPQATCLATGTCRPRASGARRILADGQIDAHCRRPSIDHGPDGPRRGGRRQIGGKPAGHRRPAAAGRPRRAAHRASKGTWSSSTSSTAQIEMP